MANELIDPSQQSLQRAACMLLWRSCGGGVTVLNACDSTRLRYSSRMVTAGHNARNLARNLGHRGPVAVPAARDVNGPWRAGGARPEPAPRRRRPSVRREMCGEPGLVVSYLVL